MEGIETAGIETAGIETAGIDAAGIEAWPTIVDSPAALHKIRQQSLI